MFDLDSRGEIFVGYGSAPRFPCFGRRGSSTIRSATVDS